MRGIKGETIIALAGEYGPAAILKRKLSLSEQQNDYISRGEAGCSDDKKRKYEREKTISDTPNNTPSTLANDTRGLLNKKRKYSLCSVLAHNSGVHNIFVRFSPRKASGGFVFPVRALKILIVLKY